MPVVQIVKKSGAEAILDLLISSIAIAAAIIVGAYTHWYYGIAAYLVIFSYTLLTVITGALYQKRTGAFR